MNVALMVTFKIEDKLEMLISQAMKTLNFILLRITLESTWNRQILPIKLQP